MAMTKKEQMALEVAQMRVREAEERVSVLFGNAPTNTFTSTSAGKYQPLLPNADIRFELSDTSNTIHARIKNGWLDIMGNTRLEIMPQASSAVQIRCKGLYREEVSP